MDTRRNRFAFLVGIAIGLMVNLGLLPWLQRGPDGIRLTTSPLSVASAFVPLVGHDAMDAVFSMMGVTYVPGQSVLMGDDVSSLYFQATTRNDLLSSQGTLLNTYDCRLDLAFIDVIDVSAFVAQATHDAINEAGIGQTSDFDPWTVQTTVSVVAGSLSTAGGVAFVSGFVVSVSTPSGVTRQSLAITTIQETEGDAVAAAAQVSGLDLLRPASPPAMYSSVFGPEDCHLIQVCTMKCDCNYNRCATRAYQQYQVQLDKLARDLVKCMSATIVLGLLGGVFGPAMIAVMLAAQAYCLYDYLSDLAALNKLLAIDIADCGTDRRACYYTECGIVIFGH